MLLAYSSEHHRMHLQYAPKPHCKNFRWKYIKNEGCKSCLVNKVQKVTFPVISRSGSIGGALCFCASFFFFFFFFLRVRWSAQVKIRVQKIGCFEIKFVFACCRYNLHCKYGLRIASIKGFLFFIYERFF